MPSFYPTMKIDTKFSKGVDTMYISNGHVGNLSRATILESLGKIISSRLASQRKQSVSIADFGTADGQSSLETVNGVIDAIQKDLGTGQDIVVYYNDQPMNDFNRLSHVIQGVSGLKVRDNVYPVIIPRTMYEQCLPNDSLDLAISSVATHYLSKQVCQIRNGISIDKADDTELRLMKGQAKADWRSFVIARGRELKPGGYLITMNISSDSKGDKSTAVEKGVLSLGRLVCDLVKECVITQEEYLATNFNSNYIRMPAEFKEPFTSDLPEVMELGLELVSVKSIKYYLHHPTFDIVNKDKTEKLEYSHRIVASVYPWMYHVLYEGLSVSRTEAEKQAIIDQYFERLQTFAFDHSDHKPYLIFTEVVIKKNHI